MKRLLTLFCLSASMLLVSTIASSQDAAYINTITQRSNKIVATLGIADSAKFYRVQNILVKQYSNLTSLHDPISASVKSIKKDSTIDKKTAEEKVTALESERAEKAKALHQTFIKSLSADLTEEQITKVKDGMTYNVLNVTYKGYTDMIPSLKEEEKKQIYAWLVESRELAMDAESSDKKHWWFGKYKGRINNYLAAAGYNITKEREEWQKRIKEAKENKTKAWWSRIDRLPHL